jgi:hypothetical protein
MARGLIRESQRLSVRSAHYFLLTAVEQMKTIGIKLLSLAFIQIIFAAGIFAQTIFEKKFKAAEESEATLDLTASAPNTSWVEKGGEAATVKIFLDDSYHQDLILFAGARIFTYRLMLGRINAGEHNLRIEFNRGQSAAKAGSIKIDDARIDLVGRSHPDFQGLAFAPILYARPNTIGRFSDIPLLMYYETEGNGAFTTLRYTVIFSNEDGGTQTSALMARWGRTTDIEWVIETQIDAQGKILKSDYQGVNHETKSFEGKREGDHPLLMTASDNNNFADRGQSEMRFALRPTPVDLSRSSREDVMDRHPWIYRIMAEEMIREGKITEERTLGVRIADLRSYLYLDASSAQQNGAALSFAVKLRGDTKWYTSDLGVGYYKIDRSGYFRTTIRLPLGTKVDQIERIAARCDLTNNPRSSEEISKAANARCELSSVNKVFLLDDQFQPGASFPLKTDVIRLPFGEMVVLHGDCASQN